MKIKLFFSKAPLAPFALLFCCGIFLQKLFPLPLWLSLVATSLLLLLTFLPRLRILTSPLFLLVLFGGVLRMASSQWYTAQIEANLAQFHSEVVRITGEVTEIRETERGFRYTVLIANIVNNSVEIRESVKVLLYTESDYLASVGDNINVVAEWRNISSPRNPGEFDFQKYYKQQNIWAKAFLKENEVATVTKNEEFSFSSTIYNLRMNIRDLFNKTVGGDAGKLLSALILGLREEVPGDIKQDFVDTGVIHVLAVSGLHVGYVLIIVMMLVKMLPVPWRLGKILIILLLVSYAVLSGGKASVWRATIMASLYVLAPLFYRKANLWNIISAAALILLVYNPNYLTDLGFLMSFSAVISIVFFLDQFANFLPERLQINNIRNPFFKGVWGLFLVSISAQIGTLPFTWSFFHRIPIISIVANIIIVPAIGLVVSLGFAITLLGSWLSFVGVALGNSVWLLCEFIFWLTRQLGSLTFSYLETSVPTITSILIYAGLITAIFIFCNARVRQRAIFPALVSACLIIWPWALKEKNIDIIYLDVGQGDAAVIRVPTNSGLKTILIDAGYKNWNRDMGERVVVPVLKYFGIKKIDLLVMSHPHSDHIGGVEIILKEIEVKEIWDSHGSYGSWMYARIQELAEEMDVNYRQLETGYIDSVFLPLLMTIFHPDSVYTTIEENVNNNSLVIKMSYGESDFLFVGDLEEEGDEMIVPFDTLLNSEVLKVGHHGSITSSSQSLLDAVDPDWAIVSVGEGNKFQHPSDIVMTRLEKSGAEVLRTDYEGAVWLKSDGRDIWRYDWR
ncbi:MAG: DNA internalization-related competence protein ComEC/Rec2 [Fidelibacterota bacterium]